jgi:hypothetical protein
MRLHLLLLLLGLPGAALAAEDRYGATRSVLPMSAALPFGGQPGTAGSGRVPRRLTWPGQIEQPAQAAAAAPPASGIIPDRLGSSHPGVAGNLPGAAMPGRHPEAGLSAAPVMAPVPSAPRFDPPRQETLAAKPGPTVQMAAPPSVPMAPPVAAQAMPPPPVPVANLGYGSARAYSVVREFGGSPDRIAAPAPQSAFRGRAEVSLLPEVAGSLSPSTSDMAEPDQDESPPPVRSAPKDKR